MYYITNIASIVATIVAISTTCKLPQILISFHNLISNLLGGHLPSYNTFSTPLKRCLPSCNPFPKSIKIPFAQLPSLIRNLKNKHKSIGQSPQISTCFIPKYTQIKRGSSFSKFPLTSFPKSTTTIHKHGEDKM